MAVSIVLAVAALVTVSLAMPGCGSDAIVVNGRPISSQAFNGEVERRLEATRQRNPKELEGEKGRRLESETEAQVATDLVRTALMQQEAQRLGIPVPVEEAAASMESERSKEGAEAFEARLKQLGVTEEQYLLELRGKILVEEIGRQLTSEVTATREEAETYYLTHKELFGRNAMVHAQHILLDTEGQAKILLEQIKDGQDFSALAKAASRDSLTKSNGGDLGWIEQGTIDPAFEEAAFALSSGKVSDIVRASEGYHIIKVLERRDASTPEFQEVETQALNALVNKKKEEMFSDYLRTLYANAQVQVKNGVGRWDPRLGMVVQGD